MKTRARLFAEMVESAEPSVRTVLARMLYDERIRIEYSEDGYVLERPCSMQQAHHEVGAMLHVLQQARESTGVREGRLDETQEKAAYEWLKQEWLLKWCPNEEKVRDVGLLYSGVINDRGERQKIRRMKNGAFNAFLNEFVGCPHVARIMLKHGFTTSGEFRNLVEAIGDFTTSEEYETRLAFEQRFADEKAELKAAAHAARNAHTNGERMYKKIRNKECEVEDLSQVEFQLLQNYEDGTTGANILAANRAYGHLDVGKLKKLTMTQRTFHKYVSQDADSSSA